jgi:hypothetical protein
MPQKRCGPYGDAWSKETPFIPTPSNQDSPIGLNVTVTQGAKRRPLTRRAVVCSEGDLSNNGWEEKRLYINQRRVG